MDYAIAEWSTSRSSEEATHTKGVKIASLALRTGAVTAVNPFKYLRSDTDCFIVKGNESIISDNAHLSDLGVASAMGEYAAGAAPRAQERAASPEAISAAPLISGRENAIK